MPKASCKAVWVDPLKNNDECTRALVMPPVQSLAQILVVFVSVYIVTNAFSFLAKEHVRTNRAEVQGGFARERCWFVCLGR